MDLMVFSTDTSAATITPIDIIAPVAYGIVVAGATIGLRALTADAATKNAVKEANKKFEEKCQAKLAELNKDLPKDAEHIAELTDEQKAECQLTEEEIAKITKAHKTGANIAFIAGSAAVAVGGGVLCYALTADSTVEAGTSDEPAAICVNGVVHPTV